MTLKKVSPNDPLIIPSSTYNILIDIARGQKGVTTRQKYKFNEPNKISFVNNTGDKLPIYAVMDVNERFAVDEESIVMDGENPTVLDLENNILPPLNQKRVCVLDQPLQDKEVGTATIKGTVKVKLEKEDNLDLNKPLRVIKLDDDHTKMAVTNRQTPDELLWYNTSFEYGIVQLGKYTLNAEPFVGILSCIPDTLANRFKIVVKNYSNGRIFHIVGVTLLTYRQLIEKPPRPRSTAVIAQYTYTQGGLDYCEFQPFFSTDMEGIVKYDDEQKILNNTVLGRRSIKDVIGSVDFVSGADSMWYGEYPI